MLWLVIAIAIFSVVLMIKGGSRYFVDDNSPEYAPIKRQGRRYIVIGALLIMALAFWNEFVYKRSQSALDREQKRVTALCTDVVKAYNKSKEPIEDLATEKNQVLQFPFLPKTSSKAIGDCQFLIQATVNVNPIKGKGYKQTYEALVEADPEQNNWYLRELQWQDKEN